MRLVILCCILILSTTRISGQESIPNRITKSEELLKSLQNDREAILRELEELKLQQLRLDLAKIGLPQLLQGEEIITHDAMSLVYNERMEQASWVAHIILPDVVSGMVGRSNDFRPDPLVKTGSSVDADYFLKDTLSDGSIKYDGFGFDRGHLAPSADFRWSNKALSESFFYSNMSPQFADFNRNSWAKLEDLMRAYVQENNVALYIVTGPLLRDDLPRIERGVNKVAIPVYYFKMALDLVNKQAVAFIMPNKKCEYPTEHYAVSIDSLENLTGRDFFPALPDSIESIVEAMKSAKPWMKIKEQNDEKPIDPTTLPKKHFNTVQAKLYQNQNEVIKVCGTVVSTKLSSKGNVFLNLDKGFPNQIFTVSIFKDQLVNFTYAPQTELMGKTICVEGKVADFNGTPSMVIEHEESIELYIADHD
jgi:endonuclease G